MIVFVVSTSSLRRLYVVFTSSLSSSRFDEYVFYLADICAVSASVSASAEAAASRLVVVVVVVAADESSTYRIDDERQRGRRKCKPLLLVVDPFPFTCGWRMADGGQLS